MLRELAFCWRFGRVIGYPLYKAGLDEKLTAGQELGYQLMRDTAVTLPPGRRLWNKFAFAVSIDPIPGVLEHARSGNQVAYVLGTKDPLVRAGEVEDSLENGIAAYEEDEDQKQIRDHLTVRKTGNRHSHMAFPAGREHLRIVTDVIYPTDDRLELEEAA